MLRGVRRETVIGKHRFREGRRVAIMTYIAVRSFEDGDALRPDREVPAAVRGLQFGAGIHHCIGYALAYAELDLAMERLSAVGSRKVTRLDSLRSIESNGVSKTPEGVFSGVASGCPDDENSEPDADAELSEQDELDLRRLDVALVTLGDEALRRGLKPPGPP